MSFVFPVLLGGLLVAGIPILIHLIMRQKPKTLPFPAFRFLILKHRTNARKLRLRHFLLLALRMLLIIGICLALARPRFFHESLSLNSERPVAAVLVFDTSMSMEYKTSDKLARLDEAKKRGQELLNELPQGSRVLILETSDAPQSARGDWLVNLGQARERLKNIKLRPASTSVLQTLEAAYRYLGELARNRDDETGRFLPRFVCVFSDRTRASWDVRKLDAARAAADQVPPSLEGLQQARSRIPAVVDVLKTLRAKLPPAPGRDYPEEALLDDLDKLAPLLTSVTKADMPPAPELSQLVESVQRRGRELLIALGPKERSPQDVKKDTDDFRDQVMQGLQTLLQELRGAQAMFVDVGIDDPADLAITAVDFPRKINGEPRQAFAADDKFLLRVTVQASGKDFNTMLRLKLDGAKADKQKFEQEVNLKAGRQETYAFEIDCAGLELGPGHHQLDVSLATSDLLPFNNLRYATFLVRAPRHVLVLADKAAATVKFVEALRALGYAPEVKSPKEAQDLEAAKYQAVYLFQVATPTAADWGLLTSYAQQGIGVGIVPGGEEIDAKAYNQVAADTIMPGTLDGIGRQGKDDGQTRGAVWQLSESFLQHPIGSPFRNWKEYVTVRNPGQAFSFWKVTPRENSFAVVNYREPKDAPALFERRMGGKGQAGKVLLLTVPLDERTPRWTDYLEEVKSYFIVVVGLCTDYLAGGLEDPMLNFLSGREAPVVKVPAGARFAQYIVSGPILEQTPAPDGPLKVKQAETPGQFTVAGVLPEGGNKVVAKFSVNVAGEESDLTRVPVAELESLLGADAVASAERRASIREVLKGHWSEPLDLFPFLMAGLLFVLALENLLANKFYRKEEEPPAGA